MEIREGASDSSLPPLDLESVVTRVPGAEELLHRPEIGFNVLACIRSSLEIYAGYREAATTSVSVYDTSGTLHKLTPLINEGERIITSSDGHYFRLESVDREVVTRIRRIFLEGLRQGESASTYIQSKLQEEADEGVLGNILSEVFLTAPKELVKSVSPDDVPESVRSTMQATEAYQIYTDESEDIQLVGVKGGSFQQINLTKLHQNEPELFHSTFRELLVWQEMSKVYKLVLKNLALHEQPIASVVPPLLAKLFGEMPATEENARLLKGWIDFILSLPVLRTRDLMIKLRNGVDMQATYAMKQLLRCEGTAIPVKKELSAYDALAKALRDLYSVNEVYMPTAQEDAIMVSPYDYSSIAIESAIRGSEERISRYDVFVSYMTNLPWGEIALESEHLVTTTSSIVTRRNQIDSLLYQIRSGRVSGEESTRVQKQIVTLAQELEHLSQERQRLLNVVHTGIEEPLREYDSLLFDELQAFQQWASSTRDSLTKETEYEACMKKIRAASTQDLSNPERRQEILAEAIGYDHRRGWERFFTSKRNSKTGGDLWVFKDERLQDVLILSALSETARLPEVRESITREYRRQQEGERVTLDRAKEKKTQVAALLDAYQIPSTILDALLEVVKLPEGVLNTEGKPYNIFAYNLFFNILVVSCMHAVNFQRPSYRNAYRHVYIKSILLQLYPGMSESMIAAFQAKDFFEETPEATAVAS